MFKSVVQWPICKVVLSASDNSSTDYHASFDEAKNTINMLRNGGMGLEGKIFPVAAWIIDPEGAKIKLFSI